MKYIYLLRLRGWLWMVMLLFLCLPAGASDYVVYCSSTNAAAGDGSPGNPYKALSSVAWASATAAAASGGKAQILLQNGSVFTGSFTFAASGIAGNPVIIDSYPGPTGERPILQGVLSPLTGWTAAGAGPGLTWQVASAAANLACTNGVPQIMGSSATTLNQGEWYDNGTTTYYRQDLGNPDALGIVFQIATTAIPVIIPNKQFLTLNNLQIKYGNADNLLLDATSTGCNDITISNCFIYGCGNYLTYFNSVNNLVCKNTVFARGMGGGGNLFFASSYRPCTAAFSYCVSMDAYGISRSANTSAAAHQLSFVNCNFISGNNEHLRNSGTGTVGLTNCILTGATTANGTAGPVLVNSSSGTINISDSIVLGNGVAPDTNCVFANVTITGPIYYRDPQYRSTRGTGLLAFITDDAPNASDWLDLATNYANIYGIPISIALEGDGFTSGAFPTNPVQQQLLLGHEIINHTRTHTALTNKAGFGIIANGPTAASLTIGGSNLTITATPGTYNVSYDLTSASYDRIRKVTAALAGAGYSVINYFAGTNEFSVSLTNMTNVNIMTNVTVLLNVTNFLANELDYNQALMAAVFTNADGSPYVPRTLAYAYGPHDAEVINFCTNRFSAARTVTNYMQYGPKGLTLYEMGIVSPYALPVLLCFENNLADSSAGGSSGSWTAGNMAYDSGVVKRGSYSAVFDGASRYATHAVSYYSDFSGGDWQMGAWVYPHLTSQGTLYYQRTDAANDMAVYWDTGGAVHLVVRVAGANTVNLATPAGMLTGADWQRLRIEEWFDEWTIRVDGIIRASAIYTNRLAIYTGSQYLGCALDSGGARVNYANGWIDNFHIANGTYRRTMALCAQMCDLGQIGTTLSHGPNTVPNEVFDIIFRACRDFTGDLRIMNYGDMIAWARSNGVVVNNTNCYVLPAANQDYRVQKSSPAVGAGNPAALASASMFDLNGVPITDAAGAKIPKRLTIGAYQLLDNRTFNNRRIVHRF